MFSELGRRAKTPFHSVDHGRCSTLTRAHPLAICSLYLETRPGVLGASAAYFRSWACEGMTHISQRLRNKNAQTRSAFSHKTMHIFYMILGFLSVREQIFRHRAYSAYCSYFGLSVCCLWHHPFWHHSLPSVPFLCLIPTRDYEKYENTLFGIKPRTNIKKKHLFFSSFAEFMCARSVSACAFFLDMPCEYARLSQKSCYRLLSGLVRLAFGAGLWRWPLALAFAPRSATITGDASPGWACKTAS